MIGPAPPGARGRARPARGTSGARRPASPRSRAMRPSSRENHIWPTSCGRPPRRRSRARPARRLAEPAGVGQRHRLDDQVEAGVVGARRGPGARGGRGTTRRPARSPGGGAAGGGRPARRPARPAPRRAARRSPTSRSISASASADPRRPRQHRRLREEEQLAQARVVDAARRSLGQTGDRTGGVVVAEEAGCRPAMRCRDTRASAPERTGVGERAVDAARHLRRTRPARSAPRRAAPTASA